MGEYRIGHMLGSENSLFLGESLHPFVKCLVQQAWVLDLDNEVSDLPIGSHQLPDDFQPCILEVVAHEAYGLVNHRVLLSLVIKSIDRILFQRVDAMSPCPYFLPKGMAHLPPGWQDSKIIVARNLANRAVHTYAEGGQVEALVGRHNYGP